MLLVVLGFYTEMAFELEWRTAAGRIGPGFFPRIVGCSGCVLTTRRAGRQRCATPEPRTRPSRWRDEVGDADLGQHPALLRAGAGVVAFSASCSSLGAIVASIGVHAGRAMLLNRGRHVHQRVLSLLLPLGMYLLFQTLLNAGLPEGIMPRF